MSGGSLDYIYCKIDEYLCDQMEDPVMDEMMEDIKKVAHDLEWWQSSDISEEAYRKTVADFKEKWINGKHIKEAYNDIRREERRKHSTAYKTALLLALGIIKGHCPEVREIIREECPEVKGEEK